jgi:hypothetical protein
MYTLSGLSTFTGGESKKGPNFTGGSFQPTLSTPPINFAHARGDELTHFQAELAKNPNINLAKPALPFFASKGWTA